MQAIRTKYLCPTNSKGARIVAECDAMRKVFGYRHELDLENNHIQACTDLREAIVKRNVKKYGADTSRGMWGGLWVSAQLPDGSYAHIAARMDGECIVCDGAGRVGVAMCRACDGNG